MKGMFSASVHFNARGIWQVLTPLTSQSGNWGVVPAVLGINEFVQGVIAYLPVHVHVCVSAQAYIPGNNSPLI